MGRSKSRPLYRMRYCCIEHQHKAKAYVDALRLAHYRPHRRLEQTKFLLIDHVWHGLFAGTEVKWRSQVVKAKEMGLPIFVYPHSVRPNIPHDLTDQFFPVTTLFTIAEGHKEVLRRIDYPNPIEVAGWPYTEIYPFRRKEPQNKIRVLFAPIHPVGNGYLPEEERALNTKTYQLLLGLLDEISLTVRNIQALEKNGIWYDERVNYIKGHFDGSTNDMERAHVVIGAFTYAHMAVALGHPLIMLGEGILPHNSPRMKGRLIYVRNWEKYKDYMHYPFNIEDCRNSKDLKRMIDLSLQGSPLMNEWKERFIGIPFDGRKFVKILKGYLKSC